MSLHGGDIYKIYRENGKKVIDYSANINSLGFPKKLKKNIIKNIDNLIHYPDPNYIELKKSISKKIGVPIESICVGNGATELIFLWMKVLKPKKILIISPTFAEYERALKEVNSEVYYFELTEGNDEFYLDFEKLREELKKSYNLVILCNPNNPTGSFVNRENFKELLNDVNFSSTNFFIDEAFIDFIKNGEDLSFKHFESDRVIIIRAFTKFFGIPGLRLGYSICYNKKWVSTANNLKEPWTINTFAASCGEFLLNSNKFIEKTYKTLEKEKNRMLNGLKKIENIQVFKSESNFLLIKLMEISGTELYNKLLEKGFLIRRCENFNFLDDSYVRIAIKDKKSNKNFIKAINKITKNRNV